MDEAVKLTVELSSLRSNSGWIACEKEMPKRGMFPGTGRYCVLWTNGRKVWAGCLTDEPEGKHKDCWWSPIPPLPTPPPTEDKEREERDLFEKAMLRNGYFCLPDSWSEEAKVYSNRTHQSMWVAWQAARQQKGAAS